MVLLERRLEHHRSEDDAGQRVRVEPVGKRFGLHPRRAHHLERPRGAAPFRGECALEQHGAGIDHGGVERGHVRRGHDPRRTGLVAEIRSPPAVHGHHVEVGADAEVLVEEPRQLAHRHAVAHRDGVLPDERLEASRQERAFHCEATDRIRPIAHDDRHAVLAARDEAVGHGVDEGVDARADVLQIDDQGVEPREHLGGGLPRFAVERVDRHAPRVVVPVRRLDHVVLQVGPEAVLRPEDGAERHAVGRAHTIDDVPELVIDRGGIGDDTHAQAAQAARGNQARRTERHCHRKVRL